jgi:hypothetical protein
MSGREEGGRANPVVYDLAVLVHHADDFGDGLDGAQGGGGGLLRHRGGESRLGGRRRCGVVLFVC